MLVLISLNGYYQQEKAYSSTRNVTVKKDNSLKLTKSQDSVYYKSSCVPEYDWEYLILKTSYELTAYLRVDYIDLFFSFIFFVFFFILLLLLLENIYIFFFFFFSFFVMQQVLKLYILLDHRAVVKKSCYNISLPVQKKVLTNRVHMRFFWNDE
jgi:hypothetical protein